MPTDFQPCPSCHHPRLKWSTGPHLYPALPRLVLHNIRQASCEVCGDTLFSVPATSPLHRCLIQMLLDKVFVLSPPEVRFLRQSMGWSTEEMSRILHVPAYGDEIVSDEARGPAQTLLRVLVAQSLGPDSVARMAEFGDLGIWGTEVEDESTWLRGQYSPEEKAWTVHRVRDQASAYALPGV